MKKVILISLLTVCALSATAQTWLPSLWSDNAVLKQNSMVTLRGWSTPGFPVNIVASWNPKDTVKVIVANTGKFEAQIRTAAGSFEPQTITFNGQPLMKNVLIGEVWLCGGQSNMKLNVTHGIKDGEKHVAEANEPLIRIFEIPLHTAESPQEDVHCTWKVCTPEVMRNSSSLAYFFARELKRDLNVPIGIVVNAWGNSIAESHMPSEFFYADPELVANTENRHIVWSDDRPGKMYNAMVAPLTPYTFSGVIWYQGESNVSKWSVYDKMMNALIKGWRTAFKLQQMPFYTVQIAPFNYGSTKEKAAPLRIMQERTARQTPNSGFIVVSDITENVDNIHPEDKLAVGQRMAALAMAETYGKKVAPYKYPTFGSISFEKKGKAVVSFDNLEGNLMMSKGAKEVVGLTVIDDAGNTVPAKGVIKGQMLEVTAPKVKNIKAVCYCFDNSTIGNLFSSEGLPVAPFNSELNKR